MPKKKKDIRFNVVSMRVSDAEKSTLDEMTRRSRTTISDLMREAMQCYASMFENRCNES